MGTVDNTGYMVIKETLLDYERNVKMAKFGYVYGTEQKCLLTSYHFEVILIPL